MQSYTLFIYKMKYAIIAAGEGSRLAAEGIDSPKPLVKVGGEYLIDRLIRVFMDNDAEEIVVICNDLTTLVAQHLVELQALLRLALDGLQHLLRALVHAVFQFLVEVL